MTKLGGEAQRLVACAYGALDLFAGSIDDLLAWAGSLSPHRPARDLAPSWWNAPTREALDRHLRAGGVIDSHGVVDPYRLALLQQTVEMLPHFQVAEVSRVPATKPRVVFTVPPGVRLPERAVDFARRTLAVRLVESLSSSTERTLLASPFWSDAGTEQLWDWLGRSVELRLPITLAGAREQSGSGHLQAMLDLGHRLKDAGAVVRSLRYEPPTPYSMFHAKVVCGEYGYLGSANLTASGLGEHVEAGIPLEPVDVERVWWMIDVLEDAGVLVEVVL